LSLFNGLQGLGGIHFRGGVDVLQILLSVQNADSGLGDRQCDLFFRFAGVQARQHLRFLDVLSHTDKDLCQGAAFIEADPKLGSRDHGADRTDKYCQITLTGDCGLQFCRIVFHHFLRLEVGNIGIKTTGPKRDYQDDEADPKGFSILKHGLLLKEVYLWKPF